MRWDYGTGGDLTDVLGYDTAKSGGDLTNVLGYDTVKSGGDLLTFWIMIL
jgi:hypothetical protein